MENIKRTFRDIEDLDGFEELDEEDQEMLRVAWEVGHVAEEDIPSTAKRLDDEGMGAKQKELAPEKIRANNDGEDGKPRKRKSKVRPIHCFPL